MGWDDNWILLITWYYPLDNTMENFSFQSVQNISGTTENNTSLKSALQIAHKSAIFF